MPAQTPDRSLDRAQRLLVRFILVGMWSVCIVGLAVGDTGERAGRAGGALGAGMLAVALCIAAACLAPAATRRVCRSNNHPAAATNSLLLGALLCEAPPWLFVLRRSFSGFRCTPRCHGGSPRA